MRKLKTKVLPHFIVSLLLIFLFFPLLVSAQIGGAWTLGDIEAILNQIATFMEYAGLILAVVFIIWGGLSYMIAGGDPEKGATAKKRILYGLIGAAIVIAVGVIIDTISYIIGKRSLY